MMARGEAGPDRPRVRMSGWWWLIVATAARGYLVFALALAACAFIPMVTGLTGSVVMSGSMMPHIHTGDVVLSRGMRAGDAVPMGRVVTFEARPGSAVSRLVLHRVVAENKDGSLVTAGDANALPDSTPLHRSGIIGRACILIPWIGLPVLWARTGAWLPLLAWMFITALAVLVETFASISERKGKPPLPVRPAPVGAGTPRRPRHAERFARSAFRSAGHPLLLLIAVATVATIAAVAPAGQIAASFSSRTTSFGNSWTSTAAATAVRLAFQTNPSSSIAGVAFASQPRVAFQDSSGRSTTSGGSVTLALTTAKGATLSCAANPVASVAGFSAFSGCSINKPGTYTLTATSGSLIAAVSTAVVITAGAASGLQFVVTPGTTRANTTFASAPQVAVTDTSGNVVASAASITLALTNPGGVTLACGTNPMAATAGVAVFAGCRINTPGTYTLTARSSGLTTATSATITISGPALPLLACQSATWIATFSWTPTPYTPTQYTLYVDGIQVQATGADGWNSYVQLTSNNVPASLVPQGTATLEVHQLVPGGQDIIIGDGTVVLGAAGYRTYLCG